MTLPPIVWAEPQERCHLPPVVEDALALRTEMQSAACFDLR
jgi:hypothetical protein